MDHVWDHLSSLNSRIFTNSSIIFTLLTNITHTTIINASYSFASRALAYFVFSPFSSSGSTSHPGAFSSLRLLLNTTLTLYVESAIHRVNLSREKPVALGRGRRMHICCEGRDISQSPTRTGKWKEMVQRMRGFSPRKCLWCRQKDM